MYNNQYQKPLAALTNRKEEIPIMNLPAKLGRNSDVVDIFYIHESISREHCLFDCIDSKFTVMDLGSTAGTYINGVRLEPNTPYFIEDGVKLAIGKVKFTFHGDLDELMRRERPAMQAGPYAPQQGSTQAGLYAPQQGSMQAGPYAPQQRSTQYPGRTNNGKVVTISARELGKVEYDESKVMYIDCGFGPKHKPAAHEEAVDPAAPEEAVDPAAPVKTLEPAAPVKTAEPAAPVKTAEPAAPAVPEEPAEVFDDEATVTGASGIEVKSEEPEIKQEEQSGHTVYLSWIDDSTGETKRLKIERFPFYIGRKSSENDYTISKNGISRKHLHFEESGNDICIYDDNSTNGIRLNGTKIKAGEPVAIRSGDSMRIAGITFSIDID